MQGCGGCGEILVASASLLFRGEVAEIERDDFATPDTLGLTLGEGKLLTAAVQAEIVRARGIPVIVR